MSKVVVSDSVAPFFKESPERRFTAVRFRGAIYVAGPHHADAIDLAFKGVTKQQRWRAYDRVAEGKEDIVFGFARGDGTGFEISDCQAARKRMYGFD